MCALFPILQPLNDTKFEAVHPNLVRTLLSCDNLVIFVVITSFLNLFIDVCLILIS